MLFDISGQTDIWTKGPGVALANVLKDNVVLIENVADFNELVQLGLGAFTGESDTSSVSKDFLMGVPYIHISEYIAASEFASSVIAGASTVAGRLYVCFADCSKDFSALELMQNAANGSISQFGIWTEQSLWKDSGGEKYQLQLVDKIQATMDVLGTDYHSPAVAILNANTAMVAQTSGQAKDQVVFSKIPSCDNVGYAVSVVLGQAVKHSATQDALASKTPVGCMGVALGRLAASKVSSSLGEVRSNDVSSYIESVELGFGDLTPDSGGAAVKTSLGSLKYNQQSALNDASYIFPMTHPGKTGVFFSHDHTCSRDDYRTISRNRVINKSVRLVRLALLEFVNSPVAVDPTTGYMSAAAITIFRNAVATALAPMVTNSEISSVGTITIPTNQNVLATDTVALSYAIVPLGTSSEIIVEASLEAQTATNTRR